MVELRNRAEYAIRRFHALEIANGNAPIIDYDCAPTDEVTEPYQDRFTALDELTRLECEAVEGPVAEQMRAHATYVAALLGEQIPLNEYVQRTQGCPARGWSEDYVQHRRDLAREALAAVGVAWGESTRDDVRALDEHLDPGEVRDAIDASAAEFEPRVREMAGTTAEFNLTIENVELDAYWSYWLDGAGHDARLRINVTNAAFTKLDAYRFAAHEVLGHALQYSSLTTSAEKADVEWPRLLSVHSTHQVLCEGLAQLLPLALQPENPLVAAFARLDHYTQLEVPPVLRSL